MDLAVSGRTALVTGGDSGIGWQSVVGELGHLDILVHARQG